MYEQASSWLEEEKREEVTKKRIQKALGNKEFGEKINTLQTVLRQHNP